MTSTMWSKEVGAYMVAVDRPVTDAERELLGSVLDERDLAEHAALDRYDSAVGAVWLAVEDLATRFREVGRAVDLTVDEQLEMARDLRLMLAALVNGADLGVIDDGRV